MDCQTSSRRFRLRIKRAIDIAGAGVGLLLLSPLLVLSAIAILGTMGWPVFFTQMRPGLRGQPFLIRKFRTMRAPKSGEVYYLTDTDRTTRVGSFLRKTSIDELPELWHVLRGQMSLVGPRPLLMEYLDQYTEEQRRRHDLRPGITGWAAVHGRQLLPFSERFALDVWYVDNWSLRLDFKILALTVREVVGRRGVTSDQSIDDVDDLNFLPHE
jgi:lipopolysaccharide/colanic/teichoic acid biosynthesis glycosyltransferase